MRAVVYDVATGEIVRVIEGEAKDIPIQCSVDEDYLEDENALDNTHYVTLGGVPAVAAKDDYILTALPLPCTITVEGVEYPCTEQPTFSFTPAGDYEVEVDAGIQYLKKKFIYTQV